MDKNGEFAVLLETIRRQRKRFAAVPEWEEARRASNEVRPVYRVVEDYWNRRKSEKALARMVAEELEFPSITFRRWAGISAPPSRVIPDRARYVDAFIPVEIADRVLSFHDESGSGTASGGSRWNAAGADAGRPSGRECADRHAGSVIKETEMIGDGRSSRVWIYGTPVTYPLEFDAMARLIVGKTGQDLKHGDYYVFLNRRRRRLIACQWDGTV